MCLLNVNKDLESWILFHFSEIVELKHVVLAPTLISQSQLSQVSDDTPSRCLSLHHCFYLPASVLHRRLQIKGLEILFCWNSVEVSFASSIAQSCCNKRYFVGSSEDVNTTYTQINSGTIALLNPVKMSIQTSLVRQSGSSTSPLCVFSTVVLWEQEALLSQSSQKKKSTWLKRYLASGEDKELHKHCGWRSSAKTQPPRKHTQLQTCRSVRFPGVAAGRKCYSSRRRRSVCVRACVFHAAQPPH